MKRGFYVIIERDEDGYFVGELPRLRACYTQGKNLDELMKNIEEVIELCLEDEEADETPATTSSEMTPEKFLEMLCKDEIQKSPARFFSQKFLKSTAIPGTHGPP